jgi:serine/threonine protein kinase
MITEFRHLLKIVHPNVVRTYRMYIDVGNGLSAGMKVYVIMELVEGSEMFEFIQQLGHYDE